MKHEDEDDVEAKAERAKREAKEKAGQARGWFGRKKEETKDATSDAGHSAHHGLHKAAVRRPACSLRLLFPEFALRLRGALTAQTNEALCWVSRLGLQVRQGVATGAG